MSISAEDLYDILNSTPLIDNRIHLLRTIDYNFNQESQPESILSWFYDDIQTQDQADQIARIFMDRFGDTIICREASCCENKFITIMDYISYSQEWEGMPCPKILLEAFLKLKFKFARQCNIMTLTRMYCYDPYYSKNNLGKVYAKRLREKKRKLDCEEVTQRLTKIKIGL